MADIRAPDRPFFPPATQARTAEPAGRTAAQRAFFEAALGRAQGAAPTTAAVASTVVAPAAPERLRAERVVESAEAPTRYLRPGSLLDIKV